MTHLTDLQLQQVRALAGRGRAIDAIKLVRGWTGLGLAEAKTLVDALPKTSDFQDESIVVAGSETTTAFTQLTPESLADANALLASGNKIRAIKFVREQTGLGLAEAKQYVETQLAPATLPLRPYEEAGSPIGKYVAVAGVLIAIGALAVWLLIRL